MSAAEWTAERLDALPDRTIIECTQVGLSPLLLMLHSDLWFGFSGVVRMPSDLIIERYQRRQGRKLKIGSIRVVSVPVAALMSDENLRHLESLISEIGGAPTLLLQSEAHDLMQRYVGLVTGEQEGR